MSIKDFVQMTILLCLIYIYIYIHVFSIYAKIQPAYKKMAGKKFLERKHIPSRPKILHRFRDNCIL